MNLIEEIRHRLAKYPHVEFKCDDKSISILPTSDRGFSVGVIVKPDSYTVSFDGWHEDFKNGEEALNCLAFGLSSECRLKEYRRGNFVYKWIVESRENGEWVADSEIGLLLFPFWRKKGIRYLQNYLIDAEPNSSDIAI